MTVNEDIIPTKISNLIEQQFPDWYIQNGPTFIEFVKQYYTWMESANNALYYSRNYYNIKDIDNTLDQFIIYFKEKYLKNIQLTTQTDTRLLVKHALDIYRSKGTQRSTKLLFQLVFDKNVQFYYPSTDLMRLSDGKWYRPTYLELLLSENNNLLNNKEIMGINSRAIAFVDSVVRRNTKGRLQDIAYISAISGNFQLGEKVQPSDKSINLNDCPSITGSLTTVEINVLGSGANYSNGQVVDISSDYGDGAAGVVTETVDQFGIIDATLLDGGYGYNVNTAADVIYISNTMLTFSNLQITNTGTLQYFQQFDTFTQQQAFINYRSGTGNFVANDTIFTYNANNLVVGVGVVLSESAINTTAGTLLVGIVSGNLANTFYTTSNAVTANLAVANGFFQSNATGKFIANDTFLTLVVNNVVGDFSIGEKVYQPTAHGIVTSFVEDTLVVGTIKGIFHSELNITGLFAGATADIENISIGVGLSNTVGSFFVYPNNSIFTQSVSGSVSKIETGSGFEIALSNTMNFTETVKINSDLISDYLTTAINAVSYGFPANTSANLTSVTIDGALTYVNTTIGSVTNFAIEARGQDYSKPPFIRPEYPAIRALQYHNVVLSVSSASGSFSNGEIVSQAATSARGKVLNFDGTFLTIENMRFYQNNWFMSTSNSTTIILGSSGSTANVDSISYDDNSDVMARNMILEDEFTVGNGAILTVELFDSGFGFLPDGDVVLGLNNATGIGKVVQQGVGRGYYRQKGGFLSDQKKLFDGFYWQNFSYEIIAPVIKDKYETMLNQLTHVAGTIMFGRLVYDNNDGNITDIQKAIVTIS